jgi:hypothetical protein
MAIVFQLTMMIVSRACFPGSAIFSPPPGLASVVK